MRMSGLISNQSIVDHERIGHGHPFRSLGQQANGGPVDVQGWSAMQTEVKGVCIFCGFQLSNISKLCMVNRF